MVKELDDVQIRPRSPSETSTGVPLQRTDHECLGDDIRKLDRRAEKQYDYQSGLGSLPSTPESRSDGSEVGEGGVVVTLVVPVLRVVLADPGRPTWSSEPVLLGRETHASVHDPLSVIAPGQRHTNSPRVLSFQSSGVPEPSVTVESKSFPEDSHVKTF